MALAACLIAEPDGLYGTVFDDQNNLIPEAEMEAFIDSWFDGLRSGKFTQMYNRNMDQATAQWKYRVIDGVEPLVNHALRP